MKKLMMLEVRDPSLVYFVRLGRNSHMKEQIKFSKKFKI